MEARRQLLATFALFTTALSAAAQTLPPPPPGVQISTTYGIEFATVGAPSNAAHPGVGQPGLNPRLVSTPFGAVAGTYRMSRTEVTTGQWLQFVNTFSTQASFPQTLCDRPAFTQETPTFWGAQNDPTYSGPGTRYRLVPGVATAANIPIGGVSLREAALYVNWLNNGQSSSPSSLWNGAYDTSTFGETTAGYTDQVTRNANARFWIPSYDEWAKAMYYDPNKPGGAGYWNFPTTSDNTPIYAPPPNGTANSGFSLGTFGEFAIPVASYPTVQSPWGLFDGAGSRSEWTESLSPDLPGALRYVVGTGAGGTNPLVNFDELGGVDPTPPNVRFAGLRIAADIPAPSVASFAFACGWWSCLRARSRPPKGRTTCLLRQF